MRLFSSSLLAGLFVIATGASTANAQAISYVVLKGNRYIVEIAANDASREKGLMYREHMDASRGMLFVFQQEAPQAFWMKNTKIPLDILYFDHERKLVSMQTDVPPCRADPCPAYPSEGSALYVLELNGGVAKKIGVKSGDVLEIHR